MLFFIYSYIEIVSSKIKLLSSSFKHLCYQVRRWLDQTFPTVSFRIGYLLSIFTSIFYMFGFMELSVKLNTKKVVGKFSFKSNRAFIMSCCKLYLHGMANGNKVVLNQLDNCSNQLSEVIHKYKQEHGKELLLYPMHVFSDEIAILVAQRATQKKLYVIADRIG